MNLNQKVVTLLKKNKLNISFAESCTGGLLSSAITSVNGSYKEFMMGLVTYSNQDKIIVSNLNGPLKYLKNEWTFKEINNATQLEFFIDFELNNPILNAIMKKSFQLGLNKIAKSFEERATKLYK